MGELKPGSRVVVTGGRYNRKSGKITGTSDQFIPPLFGKILLVDLDEGGEEEIPIDDLSVEKLSPQQVVAEIQKVKNRVNKISNLPENLRTELPTHLEYLEKEAQASNPNKTKANGNYQYIFGELQSLSQDESFEPKSWWKDVRISLDKIHWFVNKL